MRVDVWAGDYRLLAVEVIGIKASARSWEKIAATLSDLVIVTSDNPRSENPDQIIRDVVYGVVASAKKTLYKVIPDRKEAIANAVQSARPGDLVVIAGKGHEDYQVVGDRRLDFDDRVVARRAIESSHGSIHD